MKKLEECARAVVPHICRATQDIDFEQDARDFRDAKEIVRAVIRCLMEPTMYVADAGTRARIRDGTARAVWEAMLQSVLDENKE